MTSSISNWRFRPGRLPTLAVVVLCNGNDQLPHRISDEIFSVLLPKWKIPQRSSRESPGKFEPPAELVGTWTGKLSTYKQDMPFTLRIFESGDIHAKVHESYMAFLSKAVAYAPNAEQGMLEMREKGL